MVSEEKEDLQDIPLEDMLTPEYEPIDFRCIVQIRRVKDKSAGGLFLPDDYKRQKLQEVTEGILISIGVNAFQDIINKEDRPKVGEMVKFVRYAGAIDTIKGNEDYTYKIIPDGDIIGRKKR